MKSAMFIVSINGGILGYHKVINWPTVKNYSKETDFGAAVKITEQIEAIYGGASSQAVLKSC